LFVSNTEAKRENGASLESDEVVDSSYCTELTLFECYCQQQDSSYSYSLTTFSPSGKLLQIEHSLAAVNRAGTTTLGIRGKLHCHF